MTFMGLHLATSGINTGMFLGFERPIQGVVGQLLSSSERTNSVLNAGLQTKFFESEGYHLFVKEHRLRISLIPVAIAITNEFVPESWLDRVRQINTFFERVITRFFYASMVYGAFDSIRNRNGWMAAYYAANLLGGLLSSCTQNDLISLQTLELAANRCELLSLALRICASKTIKEGVVILAEATLTPLVNLLEGRYYDSLLLSLPGVSEERVKRILMVLLLDRQTRNRIHQQTRNRIHWQTRNRIHWQTRNRIHPHSPEGVVDKIDVNSSA